MFRWQNILNGTAQSIFKMFEVLRLTFLRVADTRPQTHERSAQDRRDTNREGSFLNLVEKFYCRMIAAVIETNVIPVSTMIAPQTCKTIEVYENKNN